MAQPESSQSQAKEPGTSQDEPLLNLRVLCTNSEAASPILLPPIAFSSTILDLKKTITDSIPSRPDPGRQRLIYSGKLLSNDTQTVGAVFSDDKVRYSSQRHIASKVANITLKAQDELRTLHLSLKSIPGDSRAAAFAESSSDVRQAFQDIQRRQNEPTIQTNSTRQEPSFPQHHGTGQYSVPPTDQASSIASDSTIDHQSSSQLNPPSNTAGQAPIDSNPNNNANNPSWARVEESWQRLDNVMRSIRRFDYEPPVLNRLPEAPTIHQDTNIPSSVNSTIPISSNPEFYLLKDPNGRPYGVLKGPGGIWTTPIIPTASGPATQPTPTRTILPPINPLLPQNYQTYQPILPPIPQRHLVPTHFYPTLPVGPAINTFPIHRRIQQRRSIVVSLVPYIRRILQFVVPNIWLALRISVLVFVFMGQDPTWRTYVSFALTAFVLIGAHVGLFEMLRPVARPLLQHVREAIALPHNGAVPVPPAAARAETNEENVAPQVQQPLVADTDDEAAAATTPTSTDSSSSSSTATTSTEVPATHQPNPIPPPSRLRQVERAVLVFLCSLIPGLGFEEMIAERTAVLQAQEASARLEAEARALAEEVEVDEETFGDAAESSERAEHGEDRTESLEPEAARSHGVEVT
jgi:hypothetical protein